MSINSNFATIWAAMIRKCWLGIKYQTPLHGVGSSGISRIWLGTEGSLGITGDSDRAIMVSGALVGLSINGVILDRK